MATTWDCAPDEWGGGTEWVKQNSPEGYTQTAQESAEKAAESAKQAAASASSASASATSAAQSAAPIDAAIETHNTDGTAHGVNTIKGDIEALASGAFSNQSILWHVDAVNGSDDNDGLSASTAFQTLAHAFDVANKNPTPQPSFYLYGNSVYRTPAVAADSSSGKGEGLVIIGDHAPHIIGIPDSDGNKPTLFLHFCVSGTTPDSQTEEQKSSGYYHYGYNTQSSGFRFYMAHCNLQDVIIDSNVFGMYFEGCAMSLTRVTFNIPTRFLGCTGGATSCSFYGALFTVDGTSYKPFGSSVCAGCYVYHSNLTIGAPDISRITDGNTCGFHLSESDVVITGNTVCSGQSASNGYIYNLIYASLILSNVPSGTTTGWGYGAYLGQYSELRIYNQTYYNSLNAIGSGVYVDNTARVSIGVFDLRYAIGTGSTSGLLSVVSGTSAADGGGVFLYGKDHSYAGKVRLQAYNGSLYQLDVNSDGSATFNGIEPAVTDSSTKLATTKFVQDVNAARWDEQSDTGDTYFNGAGFVTSGGKNVSFTIPFSFDSSKKWNFTLIGFSVRQNNQYLFNTNGGGTITDIDAYTLTTTFYKWGAVQFTFAFTNASSTGTVTNNDSVGIAMKFRITEDTA